MLTKQDLNQIKAVVQTEVKPLRTDISGLKTSVGALRTDVNGLKKNVKELGGDVNGLKTDVGFLRTDVNGLKKDMKTVKKDLKVAIKFFDDDFSRHAKRLNRIETDLHLPPIVDF